MVWTKAPIKWDSTDAIGVAVNAYEGMRYAVHRSDFAEATTLDAFGDGMQAYGKKQE